MAVEFAFGAALMEVASVLAKKAVVDPALAKGLESFQKWLTRDYDKSKAAQELRDQVNRALGEIRKETPDAFDRLKIVNWVTGRTPEVHQLMAAAAVEMVRPDAGKISPQLLKALDIDDSRRHLLAQFLFHLRAQLVSSPGYGPIIQYANELDQRGLLAGLSDQVAKMAENMAKAAANTDAIKQRLEQMAAYYGITETDATALEKYRAACCEQWSRLSLPLVRKNVGRYSPEIKRIFVPLMVRDDREEEKNRKEQEKHRVKNRLDERQDGQSFSVDFSVAFSKYPCFVLVGLPGSGKTTLLRRTALAFAENRPEDIGWQGQQYIPVFVRLRNFGIFLEENHAKFGAPGAGILVAYLEQNLRNVENIQIPDDFFEKRLQAGQCVILLDGLDEVLNNRVEVAQSINAFIKKFGHCGNRIGLSSRPRGYEGDVRRQLSEANLPLLEVLPLNPPGIRDLIRKVLPLLEENSAKQQDDFHRLSSRILNRQNLTEIASVPLFCACLVQVYKYHGADLPQRRVDVLAEVADLLLGFWYAQATEILASDELAMMDGTEKVFMDTEESVETKFNRLAHLAYKMQSELDLVEIETEAAARILSQFMIDHEGILPEKARDWAKRFLRSAHLQSGLFVESSPGVHSFLHKNFLEYFAASSLLMDEINPNAVIKDHLDDPRWEEILLLAAAHPKATNIFRSQLIPEIIQCAEACEVGSEAWKRRLWMAGQMASDMTTRLPAGPKKQITGCLYQAATSSDLQPSTRADLADVLDLFWEPDDLYKLIFIPSGEKNKGPSNQTIFSLGQKAPKENGAGFLIGCYPVTNAQYERFLRPENFDARGQSFWMDLPKFSEPDGRTGRVKLLGSLGSAGWDWLQKEALKDNDNLVLDGVLYPRDWQDTRFGMSRPHAPVVGISWWEANAYCRWLLAHWDELPEGQQGLPKPVEIRLPTEPEWVTAAGGEEDGRFAWGKLENKKEIVCFANTNESGIGRTTPVWMYPQGKSVPHKLMDISGNVFEWQENLYIKGQMRSGPWLNSMDYARVSNRHDRFPNFRYNYFGFRVVGLLCPPS
ncbi:MAG TPA: SUMF1/EgtB/PvdO family nonheme iron enzyme [Anaerolineaceae bacterium]|nr:SUMF1/EgtB/PvdO family nonheme iron enzyme [Anaerolineaceae bacterium]HPN54117.1 SUMF1/EgtB/PvdO family nonheme iron enzyme [Anaerolineaceae bacterium]